MTAVFGLLVGLLVVVSAALWATWTATRLDRLHHAVETARAALDAQLVRRAAVALELASAGLLDPAASLLLTGAAHEARAADASRRELTESELSGALRVVLEQPGLPDVVLQSGTAAEELLGELDSAAHKVMFARTFHNEAVTAALRLRRKRLVRWLHLAGHAAPPAFMEFDDDPPRRYDDARTA